MSSLLRPDQIASLKAIFESVDSDSSGFISAKGACRVIQVFGPQLSEWEINDMINQLDTSRNEGNLDFTEFLNMMTRPLGCVDKVEEIRSVFDVLDHDKDGAITSHDLTMAINAIGDQYHPELINAMIREIDADGSGRISYDTLETILQ